MEGVTNDPSISHRDILGHWDHRNPWWKVVASNPNISNQDIMGQ